MKYLLMGVLLSWGLLLAPMVTAQADQAQLKTETQNVLTQYRSELQDYQRTYTSYQLAKNQHQQLDTLSSLEAVVQTTQVVMLDRAEVLRTYLALLRLKLIAQPGIDITQKNETLDGLVNQIEILDKEIKQLTPPLDRLQLAERTIEFDQLIIPIEESAHRALSLLVVGELQTIYDKSQALATEIQTATATSGGALKTEQRQRSFDEINRTFNSIGLQFDEIETDLVENTDRPHHYQQAYKRAREDLTEIFASLSRSVSFLGEILSI